MRTKISYILFLLVSIPLFAQTSDSLNLKKDEAIIVVDQAILKQEIYDPLAPAQAAFYSAVIPGLGQVYNKSYWKIPIIYAGMGAGIYFYKQQDKDYNRFRDAYKRRLAGFKDDEFFGDGTTALISNERLVNAQKSAKKNRDLSVVVTVAFYLLNIVDANVDAHLRQYEVSDDLSLSPHFDVDPYSSQSKFGMSLTYKFK